MPIGTAAHARHTCPAVSAYSWNLIPKESRSTSIDAAEAAWIACHLEPFNRLAAGDQRFRFALQSAIDWRYANDPRAAIARLWAGVESLLAINAELVYRVSLCAATVVAAPGPERIAAFKKIKGLYGIRSKEVHGEPFAEANLFTALHESFELLRALLLDAVERGAVRSEEDFCREFLS